MTVTSKDAAPAAAAAPRMASPAGRSLAERVPALIALAAFSLYWLTAVALQARVATTHFGSDAHLYVLLADGIVHMRTARFHPLTTAMGMAWMQVLSPLTAWISPPTLLKAMFAAVGALGVWAAMAAFAAVVPRRYVALLGVVYATSLSIWYFASVEESKIVSATLAALYIVAYLRLRTSWTVRGAALLTAILLLACLNEIVAGFLVAIPAVDALVQRGWRLRGNWWIGWHALAAPLALIFLEVAVNGRLVEADAGNPEAASHVSMLLYYVAQNQHSLATFLNFVARWLLYSIAAPSLDATYYARTDYAGDFGPEVSPLSYLSSPASAGLIVVFGAIVAACLLPRYRGKGVGAPPDIMLALAAYALVRAAFFFAVFPYECLLFSSSTTLAHLLLIGIPFCASTFPCKRGLLAAAAALLFITNGWFMIGQ